MSERFKANYLYPLIDKEMFDDEYGNGFDHVLVVEGGDGCYIADCWVVNKSFDKHPGIDSVPVPVSINDVDFKNGIKISNIPDDLVVPNYSLMPMWK